MTTTRNLTIFEGPDGGGKTTLAQAYAAKTGAVYVHFPLLPRVKTGLARMYLEAMLPALLGYQDVVFDRSWLSEQPYGNVFRPDDKLRVDEADCAMLERVAMRCGSLVVYCLPDLEVCLETFRRRKGEEMLGSEQQLAAVWQLYKIQAKGGMALIQFVYDRTQHTIDDLPDCVRQQPHLLAQQTAGNRMAPVCMVGETFAERKDQDPWHQFPFVSFNRQGCSHWLATYLAGQGIPEWQLSWANADMDLKALGLQAKQFIALGATAAQALDTAGLPYVLVNHPQHQKRFNTHDDYPLGSKIRSFLK